ncbi:MAG: hypothetical protein J6D52_08370 [Clostridia bacterium]|nr:hypothetical protein [Clostridia bacterium]
MRTLCKKALALCVVFALALTCFVGTLSVSAADPYDATLTVADVDVNFGDTTATAVLHIAVAAPGINEAIINIDSTIGTIEADPELDLETLVVDGGGDAYVDVVGDDFSKLFLSARRDPAVTELNGILTADIAVEFTLNEGVKPGTYPINIVTEGVKAADKNETVVNLVYATEENPAGNFIVTCKHNNLVEDAELWVAPTCTEDGSKTFVCDDCKEYSYTEVDPATGHAEELTYTSNEDGTHAVDCPNCEDVFEAEDCADEDANGACDKCGYVMEKPHEHEHNWVYDSSVPAVDGKEGTITFTCTNDGCTAENNSKTESLAYHRLTTVAQASAAAESEVILQFDTWTSLYQENSDLDSIFVVLEKEVYNDDSKKIIFTKDDAVEFTQNGKPAYRWSYGIAAKELQDNMDAIVFCKVGDQWYNGQLLSDYTVSKYILSQVSATDAKVAPKMKTLWMDLANYGAKAQDYFGYRTEKLATEGLEAYQTYASDISALPTATNNLSLRQNASTDPVIVAGANLMYEGKTTIRYTLMPRNYTGSADDVSVIVKYNDIEVEYVNYDYAVAQGLTDKISKGEYFTITGGNYYLDFSKLAAKQMTTLVTIDVMVSSELSSSADYSIDTYVARLRNTANPTAKQLKEMDLCNAMLRYGAAAVIAFNG